MYPVVGDTTWWVQIVKIKFISMVSKLKKQHMLSRQRPTASCSGWRNKCSLKFYEKLCTISGWDTFSIFYKLQLLLLKKFNVFFIFICSTLSPSSTAHFQSYSIETIHATYYRISIHTLPLAILLLFSISLSHFRLHTHIVMAQKVMRTRWNWIQRTATKLNVSWYLIII